MMMNPSAGYPLYILRGAVQEAVYNVSIKDLLYINKRKEYESVKSSESCLN